MIRAKNEARFIGETLAAIYHADAMAPEAVVVVDSGSTDGTQDIVRQFPATLVQITPREFTYGYALNLGIANTRSDFIASLSAHSLPASPRWLEQLIGPFQNPRVAGVYGRQLPRPNATWLELLGMRLTGLLDERPKLLSHNPLFSNANGAFRRTLWETLPFDERLRGAEDIAWARTMQQRGYLIAYEPRAVVYHSHGEPLSRHLRRAARDIPTVIGNLLHLGPGDHHTGDNPAPGARPAIEPD